MLKVFEKSKEQIEKEAAEHRFGAKLVKGVAKPVCPYYVITKDGQMVDVSQLSEKQILTFYVQALKQGTNDKLNNKFSKDGKIESLEEANKLTRALRSPFASYKPSYGGLKTILDLFEDNDERIRSWAKDLLTPLVHEQISDVEKFAKFMQESQGNFEKPTKEQKFQIIDQLAINEQNRKAQQK